MNNLLQAHNQANDKPPLVEYDKLPQDGASDNPCNYARHPITNGCREARNGSIGMIRKRARSLLDTGYFKLNIRQASIPEASLGLHALLSMWQ